jgi:hypothetical protein
VGSGFTDEWGNVLGRCAGRITDDVVGPELMRRARREAAVRARTAMSLIRSRFAGSSLPLSAAPSAAGVLDAVRIVDDFVAGLSRKVEAETAAAVRRVGADVDREVRAGADAIAYGETIVLPPPPGWLRTVAWIRRVALLCAVFAGIWLYDTNRSGGALVAPFVTVVCCLLLVLAVPAFAAMPVVRAVGTTVGAQRASVQRVLEREIERRIGAPLRSALRKRAGLSAALADFELLRVARPEIRTPRSEL